MNVKVDVAADLATANDIPMDGGVQKTKVYIRSITFKGFSTKGALNLNNTTADAIDKPVWLTFDGSNSVETGQEITIKDGRKDGAEGATAASNEFAYLNPNFVQSTTWDDASPMPGVTGTPANLFKKSDDSAAADDDVLYVIPNNDNLSVTIEYDVLTADDNLSGLLNDGKKHGSVVKNVITKEIKTADPVNIKLAAGLKYEISLHLGLESVQFDAAVTPWGATTNGSADLPKNN